MAVHKLGVQRAQMSELTTDVQHSVTRLKSLGKKMAGDAEKFTPEELRYVHDLMAYLKELDEKRVEAHRTLEAETIKSSMIRRELEKCPEKLRVEIEVKVKSARDSNMEQLNELQSQSDEIDNKMVKSNDCQESLKLHNSLLKGELKDLSATHAGVVKKLNDSMAEKARVQIKLNETRQEFRDVMHKVNSAKKEICEVEEGMQRVRKKFTGEMLSLTRMLEGVNSEKATTEDANEEEKSKLDDVREKFLDSKENADHKTQELAKAKSDLKHLLQTEKAMEEQLKSGNEDIERLVEECEGLEATASQVREEYHTKEEEIKVKRRQYKEETRKIAEEIDRLAATSRAYKKELNKYTEDAEMQASALNDIKAKVADSKNTLLHHAEEGAKLMKDSEILAQSLHDMKISHRDMVGILQNEIADYQVRLSECTRTKEVIQSTFDALTTTVEEKTQEHKELMADLYSKIAEHRTRSSELTEKISKLEEENVKYGSDLAVSSEKLKSAQESFAHQKKVLTEEVAELKEVIADMKVEVDDCDETLSKLRPQHEAMEKDYVTHCEEYDTRKKDLIVLKSRKSGMEDRIKEVNKILERMKAPREKLKMDTLRCRAYTRQQVIQRTRQVDVLEKKVTDSNQKINAISEENKRIVEITVQTSDELLKEIERLQKLLSSQETMEAELETALGIYKGKLAEHWKKNEELEKTSSSRDMLILKDMTKLKEASEGRLQMISELHDQFESEVKGFSNYLTVTGLGQMLES